MFDFQKLKVYQKAKNFHNEMRNVLTHIGYDRVVQDQLYRASLSVALNIAEGSGRFGNKDRRHFYVVSRSSLFECVAVLDILKDNGKISVEAYKTLELTADELSRILYTMIRNLEEKK